MYASWFIITMVEPWSAGLMKLCFSMCMKMVVGLSLVDELVDEVLNI